MNYQKAFKIIDELLDDEHGQNYMIDFVPITFKNEDYAELEEFLDKHYRSEFANKIVFIAFTILYFHKSYVYLDEGYTEPPYANWEHQDLRQLDLEQLNSLIRKMIMDNYEGVNILFENNGTTSLMRFFGGYSVNFYNLPDKEVPMIKSLVNHQGLYLKTIIE